MSSGADLLSKKHEALRAGAVASAGAPSRGGGDLLSDLNDNFHVEHAAHRAAVETKYNGPPLTEEFHEEGPSGGEAFKADIDQVFDNQQQLDAAAHHKRSMAAPAVSKAMTGAMDELSKKHESLRTQHVAAPKGGNRDLLSEITDNFHTDHTAQRSAVETRYTGDDVSAGGDSPGGLGRTSAGSAGRPGLNLGRQSGGPPNIGRSSLGGPPPPPVAATPPKIVDKEMSSAADALAAKHAELRKTSAAVTRPGSANRDLLSEVTDVFHAEHSVHRAAVDTKYSGPPLTSAQSAPMPSSVRRASMGSTGMGASNLDSVPEKKKKKGGFFKKLAAIFTGDDAASQAPKLGKHSLAARANTAGEQRAMDDISHKSRGIMARNSADPQSTAGGTTGGGGSTRAGSVASNSDLMGQLGDEWHERRIASASSGALARGSGTPSASGTVTPGKKQTEHAQLEY